jgi:Flp pilus assembly protein TadD
LSDTPVPRGIPLHWIALIAALLISGAVYIQTALFEFAYDDFGQIVGNSRIKAWHFAGSYFTSHVWAQSNAHAMYYRPVFMLWLAANYWLFGLDPFYWHLAAVVLHLSSCLLLYFLVCRLAQDKWVAVVTVLLFGLHPAHVESVAWISGATEPLLAILWLGSLLCYLKYRDLGRGHGWWWAASLALALAAALAKETALVIPAIVFSYEWTFHQPRATRRAKVASAWRAAWPYACVSFAFLVMRALALGSVTPAHTKAALISVLLGWPEVIAFYCLQTLFPFRMSVFHNLVTVAHPGFGNFVAPIILAAAVAAILLFSSRRSRITTFFSWWWLITLLPLLNVTLWDTAENIHERYLYVPSVAFCVMLTLLLARAKRTHAPRAAMAALTLIGLAYALVTVREARYWATDQVLAQHGLEVTPGHAIATQLLGNTFVRQGQIPEAIPYLLDALRANPDSAETLWTLGFCYSQMNALSRAEEYTKLGIALRAEDPHPHLLLGIIRAKQNRLDEAEGEIRQGIRLERMPNGEPLFHYYLGNVLYAKGDRQGALHEYRLELLNDPAIDPVIAAAQEQIEGIEKQMRGTAGR